MRRLRCAVLRCGCTALCRHKHTSSRRAAAMPLLLPLPQQRQRRGGAGSAQSSSPCRRRRWLRAACAPLLLLCMLVATATAAAAAAAQDTLAASSSSSAAVLRALAASSPSLFPSPFPFPSAGAPPLQPPPPPLLPLLRSFHRRNKAAAAAAAADPGCDALVAPSPSSLARGSVCHGVLDYPVLHAGDSCLATADAAAAGLPTLWALLPEPCRAAVAAFTCALTHPRCDAPALPPCRALCSGVALYCGAAAQAVYALLAAQRFPADCTAPPYVDAAPPSCNAGPDALQIRVPSAADAAAAADSSAAAAPAAASSSSAASFVSPSIPRCELLSSSSVCSSLLGPDARVYIPAGFAQAAMEAAVSGRAGWLFNVAPVAHECNLRFAQFVCAQTFLPCTLLAPLGPDGATTPLPRPLCRAQCLDYERACDAAGLFLAVPSLRPNCSSVGALFPPTRDCAGDVVVPATQADFPEEAADFGGGFLSSCNALEQGSGSSGGGSGTNSTAGWTPFVVPRCPLPLVASPSPSDVHRIAGGLCATPCPILIMSRAQYARADVLLGVVVTLSFVLGSFTLASWLVDGQKRAQHYIVLFVLFTVLLAAWQLVQLLVWRLAADGGQHVADSFCASSTEIVEGQHFWRDRRASFDVTVAALQIYNIHAIVSVFWWCLNSVDLYLKVVRGLRVVYPTRQWYVKEAVFCSVGLLTPALVAALCVAYGIAGGSGLGVGFLSVHTSTDPLASKRDTVLDWPLFYLPVLLCCAVGLAAWSATMITFVRSSNATAGASNTTVAPSASAAKAAVTAAGGTAEAAAAAGAAATKAKKAAAKRSGKRGLRHYARSIVFLALCFAIFAITFAFRGYAEQNVDRWSDSAASFISCLLVEQPQARALGGELECGASNARPSDAPSEVAWLVFQAAISGLGCVSFALYGTMRQNRLMALAAAALLRALPRALHCGCLERWARGASAKGTGGTQQSGFTRDSSRTGFSTGGGGGTGGGGTAGTTGRPGAGSRRPSASVMSSRAPPMPHARRPSVSASAAGAEPSRNNNQLPVAGFSSSRRPSLSAASPAGLQLSVRGRAGGASLSPSPSGSRAHSRRGSGQLLDALPTMTLEPALANTDGAAADAAGRGGHHRPRSNSLSAASSGADARRAAAEARIRHFASSSSGSGGGGADGDGEEEDDEQHPGLSIRVSIPKPLPPDSVFAMLARAPAAAAAAADAPPPSAAASPPAAPAPGPASPSTVAPRASPVSPSSPSSPSHVRLALGAPFLRALRNLGHASASSSPSPAPASPSAGTATTLSVHEPEPALLVAGQRALAAHYARKGLGAAWEAATAARTAGAGAAPALDADARFVLTPAEALALAQAAHRMWSDAASPSSLPAAPAPSSPPSRAAAAEAQAAAGAWTPTAAARPVSPAASPASPVSPASPSPRSPASSPGGSAHTPGARPYARVHLSRGLAKKLQEDDAGASAAGGRP